jgi:predicted DNA-binding protein
VKTKHRNDKIFVMRMPNELFDRIGAAAKREDLTAAQFIRRAAERDLESYESVFGKSLRRIGASR